MARKVRKETEARQIIRFGRKLFVAVALAALAATLSAYLWPPERFATPGYLSWMIRPFQTVEERGYDALMALRGPRPDLIDPRIRIVGFEDEDEDAAHLNHRWTVPRAFHANVIRNLNRDGARLIVYDVLFSGPSPYGPEDDKALDAALKEAGNVVLTARIDRDTARRSKAYIGPYSSDDATIDFLANTSAGLAEVPADSNTRIVRSMVPLSWVQDDIEPSLPLAAYMALNGLTTDDIKVSKDAIHVGALRVPRTGNTLLDPSDNTEIPLVKVNYPDGLRAFPINEGTFTQAAKSPPEFTKGLFKDKIAFVGVTGENLMKELGEQYPTAYSSLRPDQIGTVFRSEIPGVVLQALHFNALVKGTFMRDTTFVGIWGMVFLTTLGAIALVRRFSNLLGLLLVLACGFMVFCFAYFSMRYASLHVPWVIPISLIFASAGGVGWLESGSIKRKWAGYVSPAVLEQILQSDESIGAQRYEASVMFGDIRGFTSFSEKHSPEAVVYLLNRHLEKMTAIISKDHGTIDKFLGDGILAVFGAPIPFDGSAVAAVKAAWYMREAAMLPILDAAGEPHVLATGFGITTGSFLGGDIGSKQLRNWTIIGDTVNLASRLQGVTGEPDVIIDEPTYALVRPHVEVQSLGAVTLKGKAQPVPCYKVIAWSDLPMTDPAGDRPVRDAVVTT